MQSACAVASAGKQETPNGASNVSFPQLCLEFSDFLQACEFGGLERAGRLMGVESTVLRERLVQILCAETFSAAVDRAEAGLPLVGPGFRGNLGPIVVSDEGTIFPSAALRTNLLGRYWLRWAWCGLRSLAGMIYSRQLRGVKLITGVGKDSLLHSGKNTAFAAFCRLGPIEPLRLPGTNLVDTTLRIQDNVEDGQIYRNRASFYLLQHGRLSFFQRLRLLKAHLRAPLQFLCAVRHCPAVALLADDWALSPGMSALVRAGSLRSWITTNSHYLHQPLWVRQKDCLDTHMVWYSQNIRPIRFKDEVAEAKMPAWKWARADSHWVWTQQLADYLAIDLEVPGEIKVVGPIMFYLPPYCNLPTQSRSALAVSVFDVSPVELKASRAVGLLRNYYSVDRMMAWLGDIVAVSESIRNQTGRNVALRLKHKRPISAVHEGAYADYVQQLAQAGSLELVDAHEDLFELAWQSDVCVVVPNSSPALVADALGVPAIYYDGSGDILFNCERGPNITAASGRDSLVSAISKACGLGAT